MASFTNISAELRFVSHGLPAVVAVKPGEQVQVPDDVAPEYACQPGIWAAKPTRKSPASTAGTNAPTEG